MNIVAVSGKICSGKTTLAKAIVEADPRYKIVPLAAPLKADIAALCGVDVEYIAKNKDLFRPILQYYGTDIRRTINGPDYWVERLFEYATSCGFDSIIVDDVRYPNEIESLADGADNFMAVRLLVDTEVQMARYEALYGPGLNPSKLFHLSETALDGYFEFDMSIVANIPPEDVAQLVLDALERRGMLERIS